MVLIAGAALIPRISLARPVQSRSPFIFGVVVRDDAGMSYGPVAQVRTYVPAGIGLDSSSVA